MPVEASGDLLTQLLSNSHPRGRGQLAAIRRGHRAAEGEAPGGIQGSVRGRTGRGGGGGSASFATHIKTRTKLKEKKIQG